MRKIYLHEIYCKLTDKKTSLSKMSGRKRERRGLATYPDLLNTLSDGTLVAHTHKYFLDSCARAGKRLHSFLHHSSGSTLESVRGKSR